MGLSGILSKTKAFSCLRKEATGRYSPWFTWMSSATDRCFKPPHSIFKLYSHTAISLKNVSFPLKCTWVEIFREISDTHCNLIFQMKIIPLLFGSPAARKQTLKDVKVEARHGKIHPLGKAGFCCTITIVRCHCHRSTQTLWHSVSILIFILCWQHRLIKNASWEVIN